MTEKMGDAGMKTGKTCPEEKRNCQKRGWMRHLTILLSGILLVGTMAGPAFAVQTYTGSAAQSEYVAEASNAPAVQQFVEKSQKKLSAGKKSQKLKIKASKKTLSVGQTATVKGSGAKQTSKYTYHSSNKKIATVSAAGKVTAKSPGKVKIEVRTAATSKYKAGKKSVTIKVLVGATSKLMAVNQKKGIKVMWEKVSGASGYILYRNGKKIKTFSKGSTVSYVDTGATKEKQKYTYKLVAKGKTGTSTLSKTVVITRLKNSQTPSTQPQAPATPKPSTPSTPVTPKPSTPSTPSTPAPSGSGSSGQSGSGSSSSGSGSSSQSGSGSSSSGQSGSGSSSSGQSGSGSSSSGQSGSGSSSSTGGTQTTPSGYELLFRTRFCFEERYVPTTLNNSQSGDLAVIDTDGIDQSLITAARNRGVLIYGYLNAGALEQERSYASQYQDLRIAPYEGWDGEYWVDVTNQRWKDHLIQEARNIKATGAVGIYFDNLDVYYMAQYGFRMRNGGLLGVVPSADAVYAALSDVIKTIQNTVEITVMPNGGDVFVRRFAQENPGVLRAVNQEGVLYDDNSAQSAGDTRYLTEYLDWCKSQGMYIRGIEYINTEAGKLAAAEYYKNHGWNQLYVSPQRDLRGN